MQRSVAQLPALENGPVSPNEPFQVAANKATCAGYDRIAVVAAAPWAAAVLRSST